MANERNAPAKAKTAADWSRVVINGLQVYKTSRQAVDNAAGTTTVFTDYENADTGEFRYQDPVDGQEGWFTKAEAPANWELQKRSHEESIMRDSNGMLGSVSVFENDSSGNEIPHSSEQKYMVDFGAEEIRTRAAADPAYLAAYGAVTASIRALMELHYKP
jgi:hypothetical protein